MQLFVAAAHEVPLRPCRSTGEDCSASGSHQPGDALLDSVLSKADPEAISVEAISVEAILLEARAAEAQGRFALAARLFSRAFWRCRHEPLQGGSLAIYLDMVQCRLLLGDSGFALDALHALQVWSGDLDTWSDAALGKSTRELIGKLLAKASCDMLHLVSRRLAEPLRSQLAEGSLRVQLLDASGLAALHEGPGQPALFARLSLAGQQLEAGTRDAVWAEDLTFHGTLRRLTSEPLLLHVIDGSRNTAFEAAPASASASASAFGGACLGYALVDLGALRRRTETTISVQLRRIDPAPAGAVRLRLSWSSECRADEADADDAAGARRLLEQGHRSNEAGEHAAAAAAFGAAYVRRPQPSTLLSAANMLARAGEARGALALLALLEMSGAEMRAETRRTLHARRLALGRLCLLRAVDEAVPRGVEEEGGGEEMEGEGGEGEAAGRGEECGGSGERSARAEARSSRAEAAMLEGHAANRAGELGRACGCFAAAFRLRALPSAGGAAALISLCNMRARQGHHEWCAHALLLLLCSARPLTERERAGVARLLGMPRHELPPVWTAVMLSQLMGSLVRLPRPEPGCPT